MTTTDEAEYLAECFLPGVQEADLQALDARAQQAAAALAAAGGQVRYLGSLLLREDEVVLCRFAGSRDAVHEAARRAQVPFERILETASSPWVGRTRNDDDVRGLDR
jgi:hypothetical protein